MDLTKTLFQHIKAPALRMVSIAAEGETLILNCHNLSHADSVAVYADAIAPIAIAMDCTMIVIRVGARVVHRFPSKLPLQLWEKRIMSANYRATLSEADLLCLAKQSRGISLGVIEMQGDRGLWTNGDTIRTSGVKPAQWEGQDMSRWWIDDHLKRFKAALEEYDRVSEFGYRAILMTGEPRQFIVNAQLIIYRGRLCRLVEVLGCEPT